MKQMNAVSFSASGVVHAGQCVFFGASLCAGSTAATLIVYDNASAASGTVIARINALTGDSKVLTDVEIPCANGIYVAVTGTGVTGVAYK